MRDADMPELTPELLGAIARSVEEQADSRPHIWLDWKSWALPLEITVTDENIYIDVLMLSLQIPRRKTDPADHAPRIPAMVNIRRRPCPGCKKPVRLTSFHLAHHCPVANAGLRD